MNYDYEIQDFEDPIWENGGMCKACKKADAPPSESQKKAFDEVIDKLQAAEKFLRDNEE